MRYEFELDHKARKVIKNICLTKSKGAVDPSIITRWLNKFRPVWKNLDGQASLSRPKIVDSKNVFQSKEAKPASNTQRVSSELGISQATVVRQLHELGKSMPNYRIVPLVTKILQNLWLSLVFWTSAIILEQTGTSPSVHISLLKSTLLQ